MASSYKIKRSKESKVLYCVLGVLFLYRYINLFRDNVLDKTLLFVSTSFLLLFFVIVYLKRIFLFNNYIVLISAPLFFLAKYSEVEILESECITNKKNDCHFIKDKNQLCLKVKNKVYSFSTYNNEEVIDFLKEKQDQ